MPKFNFPSPQLTARPVNSQVYQQAINEGLHPFLAKLLAGRLTPEKLTELATARLTNLINPSLGYLAEPQQLLGMQATVARLKQAVINQEELGLVTDYDVDGLTSHAIFYFSLTEYFNFPANKIHSFIGHRLEDGYGLSTNLANKILANSPKISLIITADCGSSDEERLALLKQAGIDSLVTDHHQLPEAGAPKSALACVNPSQKECTYPDKFLAGCGVAWLTMLALRNELVASGHLPASTPKLTQLLPFVALGTVADCVSLGASAINRSLIAKGLEIMNTSNQPCWQAYRQLQGQNLTNITALNLAFQLGPRINAASRMASPYTGLHFFLAKDLATATAELAKLDADNQARRNLEAQMLTAAYASAAEQKAAGMLSLVAYLPEGHAGIQGIVASRLVEKYGLPTLVATPAAENNQLTASARCPEELNLYEVLQQLDQHYPGLLIKFGGHKAAAGLSFHANKLAELQAAFNSQVKIALNGTELHPKIYTDGELEADLFDLTTINLINQLQPFGREFEEPVFVNNFYVQQLRLVGKQKVHLQLELSLVSNPAVSVKAIWFNALAEEGQPLPFEVGSRAELAFELQQQEFRNQVSLQLVIKTSANLS